MPRTFKDSLAEDVEQVFLNTDEFAIYVTLVRGVHETHNVVALVSIADSKAEEIEGIGVNYELRDYAIRASSYVIDGAVVDPRQGDLIRETLASGEEQEWEVLPLEGKLCFERDVSGLLLKVHTVRVGDAL